MIITIRKIEPVSISTLIYQSRDERSRSIDIEIFLLQSISSMHRSLITRVATLIRVMIS